MKRVTILVPDDIEAKDVFIYDRKLQGGVYLNAAVVEIDNGKKRFVVECDENGFERIEEYPSLLNDIELRNAVERLKKSLATSPLEAVKSKYLLSPYPYRHEFEDLQRRVKALEAKSEATVQRVTKSQN